jgi:hypothetical protein
LSQLVGPPRFDMPWNGHQQRSHQAGHATLLRRQPPRPRRPGIPQRLNGRERTPDTEHARPVRSLLQVSKCRLNRCSTKAGVALRDHPTHTGPSRAGALRVTVRVVPVGRIDARASDRADPGRRPPTPQTPRRGATSAARGRPVPRGLAAGALVFADLVDGFGGLPPRCVMFSLNVQTRTPSPPPGLNSRRPSTHSTVRSVRHRPGPVSRRRRGMHELVSRG